jgi:aspartyl-tRNA(Asn)/glutamyl-tRNA(Gln) amidotransferase subunit A
MQRCLQQQAHRRLSSRFLTTTTTTPQHSWRLAVKEKNASVNALVYVVPDDRGNVTEGPLNGMTVAVKDNICTKNMPTTCSSAMLQGKLLNPRLPRAHDFDLYIPSGFSSPLDATVIQLLSDSGATIIGKANCDEFGMGQVILRILVSHQDLSHRSFSGL